MNEFDRIRPLVLAAAPHTRGVLNGTGNGWATRVEAIGEIR